MAVTEDRIQTIMSSLQWRQPISVTPEEYDVVSQRIQMRPEGRDWEQSLRQNIVGGKTTEQIKQEQKATQQAEYGQAMKRNLDQYLPGMYDAMGGKAVANGFWAAYNEYAQVLGKPTANTWGGLDWTVVGAMRDFGGVNAVNEAANNYREFRSAERKEKRMNQLKNVLGVAAFGLGGVVGGALGKPLTTGALAGAGAAAKISPDIAASPLVPLTALASSLPKTSVVPEGAKGIAAGAAGVGGETLAGSPMWNKEQMEGVLAKEGESGGEAGEPGFWDKLWDFAKSKKGLLALGSLGYQAGVVAPMVNKEQEEIKGLRELERQALGQERTQTEEGYADILRNLQRLQQRQIGEQQTSFRERGIAQAGITQPLRTELGVEQAEETKAQYERPRRHYLEDWEIKRKVAEEERDVSRIRQRLAKYKGFLQEGIGVLTPALT